jgi:agmatine deiminase
MTHIDPKPYKRRPEWEPHEATWIGWPHYAGDWPGKFNPIPLVFAEMVRHLAVGDTVRLLVLNEAHQQKANRLLEKAHVNMQNVEFFQVPTDRGWTRDFGPLFVKGDKDVAISRFRFNAWARYPNFKNDDEAPEILAKRLNIPLIRPEHKGKPVVLEGGAIEVNGKGILMTTEECLLDQKTQVRNPGLSKSDMETVLKTYLGVDSVLWLNKGIVGDDTHGHVDDFCRFVSPDTVVLCEEKNQTDPNHAILEENKERLSTLNVIRLPMPDPLYFDGTRVPASYANFYIGNEAILVPTFNDAKDRIALGILAELFPKRRVVGIHAVDLIWGFGAIHCLTNDQPKAR